MEYISQLRLLDAITLLEDRLTELHEAEQLPDATFNRKSAFRMMLRSVNQADRMICDVRKKVHTLALYLPKEVHMFPMARHKVYTGEQVDSVTKSELYNKHPAAIDLFINDQPWVEIAGIESEYAQVYEKHPTHQVAATRSIRRVNLVNFDTLAKEGTVFSYDTDRRMLRFSEPFKEDVFLVFQARTRPGEIKPRQFEVSTINQAEDTELAQAKIGTPSKFERLLIDVALSLLVPTQTQAVTEADIIARTAGREDANGPTVMFPKGQYEYFGQW